MKICAISDIHGQFDNLSIEPVDILFICGDIVPLKIQNNIPQSFKWFEREFIKWCNNQPVNQIYLVGGNHDAFLERSPSEVKDLLLGTNITILYNEYAEYHDVESNKTYVIWGSPLCHIFGNWSFMYSDEYEKEKFDLMPKEFDFLITHDAAYGRNDICFQNVYWNKGEHIGNPALSEVLKYKKPKYHFTGHLHSSDHNLTDYNGTLTACVSLLDENYNMTYLPLYLDI